MKNIFKSKLNIFLMSLLVMGFALGFVSETLAIACPQFNCDSQDLELLVLKNRTQSTSWQDPISANCGDRVAFQVYYHNCIEGSVAHDTKIRIDYPDVNSTTIVSTAYLWAYDADYVSDTGTINSSTAQKLVFDTTAKWYPNQTSSNPTTLSVTQYYRSVEVNIGDIQGGWPSQGYVTFEATLTGCQQTVPTVDIKANGSDGTVTIPYNSSANLTWTSTNATSCYASGDWSGTKGTSGSETTYNLTYSKTYTITCTGSGGSASDSVTVNTQSQQISYVSLTASPSSGCVPLNNVDLTANVSGTTYYYQNINYYFDCTNDGYWDRTVSSSSTSYTAYDVCNYPSSGNYYAKVRVESGGFTAENTTPIYVSSCSTGTLSITKSVRNLTDNTSWLNEVSADPGEFLAYSIQITASSGSSASNVILTDVLPAKIIYRGNLKIDGVSSSSDIASGLNLGTLYSGQSKTVTFEAQAASVNDFAFGTTTLTNTATVTSSSTTNSDTATVSVLKRGVAGAVTGISTGVNPLYVLPFFVLILSLILYLIVKYLENSKNPLIRKILGAYYRIKMYIMR
jgi:uncharacterized repeat protein (TIGR01451 family)